MQTDAERAKVLYEELDVVLSGLSEDTQPVFVRAVTRLAVGRFVDETVTSTVRRWMRDHKFT